jgi:hypothetical protein
MYHQQPPNVKDVVVEGNKMNFKDYFSNFEPITEEAKINIGDFTELLFAAGLLHYTLNGEATPQSIIETLNSIPSLPYENLFSKDLYDVFFKVDGKANLSELINGNYKNLPSDVKETVDDIINKISKHLPQLKTIHKVDAFVKTVMQTYQSKEFVIGIESKGSKSAQQDEVKADVSMKLIKKGEVEIPKDLKDINFSVKYGAQKSYSKVSETSIFTLILRLGNILHLPMTSGLEDMRSLPYKVSMQAGSKWLYEFLEEPKYKELSLRENHLLNFIRKMYTTSNLNSDTLIQQFLAEFNNEIVIKERKQPAFSHALYNFLEMEIFGKDSADIVKIDNNGISDIDIQTYKKVKENYLIDFSSRPSKSKNLFFKFEAVAKDGTSFLLFWIENHKSNTIQVHVGDEILK